MGLVTTETLPTDTANAITYVDQNYVGDLPQNIPGSPLCHVSVSQWCMVADKKVGSVERKERCARLAGDIAAKTVEILNSYFASTFVSTFTDPETNGSCMICHGSSASDNASTHMECVTCHTGDPHAVSIKEVGSLALATTLGNPYPNPFRNETTVEFSLLNKDKARLEVYDMQGRLVKSLIDSDYVNPGTFSTTWRGDNNAGASVPSGIYLIKLTTGKFSKTVKVNLSK